MASASLCILVSLLFAAVLFSQMWRSRDIGVEMLDHRRISAGFTAGGK